MENIKQYEIKTVVDGWTRLENYRDGYVIAIKEFQGVCVNITNFSCHSLHNYSIADLDSDSGDWSYICDEKLLEQVDGEEALKKVLVKYHLTEEEIAEVLSFDFDDKYSESYNLQAEQIRQYMESERKRKSWEAEIQETKEALAELSTAEINECLELVHMTFEKSKELIFEELARREKNKK
ncbi:hypothetical protein LD289_002783 [Listeria monocytogenes]|nr:hypothetical protein [Listeria monocytogenes]